ncbi:MAG: response regulator [Chitinivibrionales bacterium]|nr:response regulator [Chitinivibrionales bacterium]
MPNYCIFCCILSSSSPADKLFEICLPLSYNHFLQVLPVFTMTNLCAEKHYAAWAMNNQNVSILAVDDEELMRSIISDALEQEGLAPVVAESVSEATVYAQQNPCDLLITDLNLPGEDGIDLIRYFRKNSPATGIIAITGFPDSERVRLMEELEVNTFLIKPFTARQLRFSVLGAIENLKTHYNNRIIFNQSESNSDLGLIGVSSYMSQLRRRIRLMASGDFPVLILGESGTGKEIVAHAVHQQSMRNKTPMITINCAAIPRHLEESEFFGYVKGAFTGAHANKLGIIESANNSTIFLDEIGELSLEVQAKLLRVLDNGEYIRIGETTPRKVDIRILSATNRSLEAMVEQGTFRKDLYYRLNAATIATLPLAEHREDIAPLTKYFLTCYNERRPVTAEALHMLSNKSWAGNVRELKNAVKLLCTTSNGYKRINAAAVKNALSIEDAVEEPDTGYSYREAKSQFEFGFFTTLLKKHQGNISRVAREAGIHRPNLIRKLKEIGISTDCYRLKA